MGKKIKILIVDDSKIHIIGLKSIISEMPEISSIYEAHNPGEAMNLLNEHNDFDTAIIDISLETNSDGLILAQAIYDNYPKVRSIILSHYKNSRYIYLALSAHVMAYLAKDSSPETIINAIRTINNGHCIFFGDTISENLINSIFGKEKNVSRLKPHSLTKKEIEVLCFITNGLSSKEIAAKMGITVNTVETNKERIKNKLGYKTITEAVAFGIKHGIFGIKHGITDLEE